MDFKTLPDPEFYTKSVEENLNLSLLKQQLELSVGLRSHKFFTNVTIKEIYTNECRKKRLIFHF